MFEIVSVFLIQLIETIPYFIALILVFEFIGYLLFGK